MPDLKQMWGRRDFRILLLAILTGVGLRLFLALAFHGNWDQDSYEIVVGILRRGGNFYAETPRYNYTPVWALILLRLDGLAAGLHVPFHFAVRGFLTLVDVCVAVLVAALASRTSAGLPAGGLRPAWAGFIAYFLSPVAILIIGFHGQFENLAILPLLLAVYLYGRRPEAPPRAAIWLLGTLSLVIKHITLFGVWTLFWYAVRRDTGPATEGPTPPGSERRKPWMVALAMLTGSVLIFLATFLPYLPAGMPGILKNVLLYEGLRRGYGMEVLFPRWVSTAVFAVLMAVAPLVAERILRLPLLRAMELSFVAFLALAPGIGEQYFLMPVIWGSVARPAWYWVFTLCASIFLAGSRNNINIPLVPSWWNSVWLAAAGWLLSYFVTWRGDLRLPEQFRRLWTAATRAGRRPQ